MMKPVASERGSQRTSRIAAAGLSALVFLAASLVFVGWAAGLPALRTLLPSPVSMKLDSAASLLACALTLALWAALRRTSPLRHGFAVIVAAVFLVAVGNLLQDLTGIGLGINQWLFRDADPSAQVASGRFAATAAYCLMLVSLALLGLLYPSPKGRQPLVLGAGLSVCLVAALSVLGHTGTATVESRIWNFAPMASDTAVCLLFLGVALTCAARAEGLDRWAMSGATTAGFAAGAISLVLAAASTYYLARNLQDELHQQARTQEVLSVVGDMSRDLVDAAGALRALLEGGDERLAATRPERTTEAFADLRTLQRLVGDDPAYHPSLERLRELLTRRAALVDQAAQLQRERGLMPGQRTLTQQSLDLTNDLQSLVSALRYETHVVLQARQRQLAETSRRGFVSLPLGVFVSVTLLIWALLLLNRSLMERETSQRSLHHRDALFQAVFDASPDAIVISDIRGKIAVVNPAAQRVLGYPVAQLVGMQVADVMPGLRDEALVREREALIARQDVINFGREWELDARRSDGSTNPVEVIRSALFTPQGGFVVGVIRDLSARREQQQRLQRLTDFYAALSQTNQAVVHVHDEQLLYQEICRICVDFGHASMAYIALVDGEWAIPTTFAGPGAAHWEASKIALNPSPPEIRGPIATAIHRAAPYVVNDFCADPATLPWRARAERLGTQSTAAFPIKRAGHVVGALSLHMPQKDFFDAQVVALLSELTGDLSFALDNLDREAARLAAQAELAASEQRIRHLFEQAADGIFIFTADYRYMDANDAGLAMLGYAREELKDLRLQQVLAPHELPRLASAMADVLAGTHHLQEWEHVRRDGTAFWGEVSARALQDGQLLAIVRDLSERKRAEGQLRFLATHDALTELPNQGLMRDLVDRAVARAKRLGGHVALLCLDLDRFKVVNDAYGHPFGDAALVVTAKRLRSLLREEDTVARLGGNKFLVLLPELRRSAESYVAAKKLIDAFEAPLTVDGQPLHLSASVGISVYPENGDRADQLISNADVAMYRAKALGRGTLQFFAQEMSDETRHQVALETQLRQAILQDGLHLAYQPKVDAQTGAIVGCEALVRWKHPTLGTVSPGEFIPIAEESGLIVPLGDWVLRTACLQAKAWQDSGLPDIPVAVNVSARQFLQKDIVGWVLRTLKETGLAPRSLELELTESLLAQDTEKAVNTVVQLQAAGVKMSIDDFGTGYSSLSYLKRFRVDTLKIDQSFVAGMLDDAQDAVIVGAVISLAHALQLTVIAEGVENAEQLEFLREHGCDEVQGYFFSKPVSADVFAKLLEEGLSPMTQTL